MKFYDFEYDGLRLSNMGFVVCNFGSSTQDTKVGSQLNFNTVSQIHGTKHDLINASYENCLETTFQICKNICNEDVLEVTVDEIRKIYSWLNRKSFCKFKIVNEEYSDIYVEGSFNISLITRNGTVYGFELNLITNRPFALKEPRHLKINNTIQNGIHIINDISDEEGYLYPDFVEIEILQDGDLSIKNMSDNDRVMYVGNCSINEVITLKYPIITTSDSKHLIQNDFNWNFFRIVSSLKNKKNSLEISIPCNIKIVYSPVVKIAI